MSAEDHIFPQSFQGYLTFWSEAKAQILKFILKVGCLCSLMRLYFVCLFLRVCVRQRLFISHLCFPVASFVFGVSRVVCAVCIVCPHTLIVPKLSPFIRRAARAEYLILNNMEHISFVFQQI